MICSEVTEVPAAAIRLLNQVRNFNRLHRTPYNHLSGYSNLSLSRVQKHAYLQRHVLNEDAKAKENKITGMAANAF